MKSFCQAFSPKFNENPGVRSQCMQYLIVWPVLKRLRRSTIRLALLQWIKFPRWSRLKLLVTQTRSATKYHCLYQLCGKSFSEYCKKSILKSEINLEIRNQLGNQKSKVEISQNNGDLRSHMQFSNVSYPLPGSVSDSGSSRVVSPTHSVDCPYSVIS